MSVNHQKRVEGVVKEALDKAAMGRAYGYVVTPPAFWPQIDGQGNLVGQGAAWCITVTLPTGIVGEPDINNGFPVFGFMPKDDDFRNIATSLLAKCVQDLDAKQGSELDQARAKFQQQMAEAKS